MTEVYRKSNPMYPNQDRSRPNPHRASHEPASNPLSGQLPYKRFATHRLSLPFPL